LRLRFSCKATVIDLEIRGRKYHEVGGSLVPNTLRKCMRKVV
jgi:hypothetical protein